MHTMTGRKSGKTWVVGGGACYGARPGAGGPIGGGAGYRRPVCGGDYAVRTVAELCETSKKPPAPSEARPRTIAPAASAVTIAIE